MKTIPKTFCFLFLSLHLLNSQAQTSEKKLDSIIQYNLWFQNSISSLNKLIKLHPESYNYYFLRGILEINDYKWEKANKDFIAASNLKPRKSDTILAYYYFAGKQNGILRSRNAIRYYSLFINLDSTYDIVYAKLGECEQFIDSNKKAIKYLDKAIKLDKNYTQAYYERGISKDYLNDKLGAIADLTSAIELGKKDGTDCNDIFRFRGEVFEDMGKYDNALKDYYSAISLDSSDFRSYNQIASTLNKLGKYRDAIIEANKTIKHSGGIELGYNERGNAKLALGDTIGALRDYNYAIKHGSLVDYSSSLLSRGKIKVRDKKYKSAISDFSKAIQQDGLAEAYYERGKTELILKQEDKACQDFQKAISLGWLAAKKLQAENCK